MTQIFDEAGKIYPVTIVDVSDVVISKHLKDGDRISHVELGKGVQRKSTKPDLGNYKAIPGVPIFKATLKLGAGENPLEVGAKITADVFEVGDKIDVIGTSKGKGFQGVMKRHNFKGGPKTHGSGKHRHGGSIGSGTTPGRVIKGMKMPGHMGDERKTVQNLRVAQVNSSDNLIAIRGAVPGSNGDYIIIRPALRIRQDAMLENKK